MTTLIIDADGEYLLIPACWTYWKGGSWLYRRDALGNIEAMDTHGATARWRALEAA